MPVRSRNLSYVTAILAIKNAEMATLQCREKENLFAAVAAESG
jgi:hypothetical protein